MRLYFLVLFSILVPLFSHSQSRYNDYSSAEKTFKYREDFNSSSGSWEADVQGKSEAYVRSGALVYKSINDKAQAKYKSISGMDWSGDWEIEIGVRWINGKENSSIDLIWDRTAGESRKYHFGFTAARKYNISEYNEGYQQIVGFTKADYVYKNTRNRLTVRHVNGYYYFFVNERFVKTYPSKTITGDYIGFMVPPSSTIEVDFLYARQLKKSSSGAIASTTEIESKGGYIGVMTKSIGYNVQRWKTREAFPKDAIKTDWSDGYSISDLSYDNYNWTLIMSKGTGYSTQNWITRKEWKREDIKEKWDEGYLITELEYGNGVYAIVFSKSEDLGRQRWATKVSDFPSDKIKEFYDDGLTISELIYGKDRWVLVATKDSRIKNQKWFKRTQFPTNDIKTYTDQGYAITQLSKENGWWVLVMSQYHSGRKPTVYFNSATFPKEQIRKYWEQGYYLTDLTHVNAQSTTNSNSVVSNKTSDNRYNSKTPLVITTSALRSKLIGQWYGGSPEENEKGTFKFYSNGNIEMIDDSGQIIGGDNYYQDGIKIDLTFEISASSTPHQLDFVFASGEMELGKMRGIINFIDKDTFEFVLADEISGKRPTSFSGKKRAVFKRQ